MSISLLNKTHAFEPFEKRTQSSKEQGSAATTIVAQKAFEKTDQTAPLNFPDLPDELKIDILSIFDLRDLAQFSCTSKMANVLAADPRIWKSISRRINCPVNGNSDIPIYKQVLAFIEQIQGEAILCKDLRVKDITQILIKPSINEINKIQDWLQAKTIIDQWIALTFVISLNFRRLNTIRQLDKIGRFNNSEEIVAKANELGEWLSINRTFLQARDTLVVWQNLAKAVNLQGPGLDELTTEDAVIQMATAFPDWFAANQNVLSQQLDLDLSNKLLTSLPEQICNLPRLNMLDLRGNQLTSLPDLSKVLYVRLENNPDPVIAAIRLALRARIIGFPLEDNPLPLRARIRNVHPEFNPLPLRARIRDVPLEDNPLPLRARIRDVGYRNKDVLAALGLGACIARAAYAHRETIISFIAYAINHLRYYIPSISL